MERIIRDIEIVDDKVAEILKTKTPAERLKIAFDLWHSTNILLKEFIKSLHPQWDEIMVHKELVRRLSHGVIEYQPNKK